MDHNRLKQLAGISETEDDALDSEIAADDAGAIRLEAVRKKVKTAFVRSGLPVDNDEYAIDYDASTDEVRVTLEYMSGGYSLSLLERLRATLLADDYLIQIDDMSLVVVFSMN